jgi:transcription elongation factor Elf1
MKCKICGKRIEETFLKKLVGTYVKDKKGKKHTVCPECQQKYSIDEIKEKI